jgi:hypothetical protein
MVTDREKIKLWAQKTAEKQRHPRGVFVQAVLTAYEELFKGVVEELELAAPHPGMDALRDALMTYKVAIEPNQGTEDPCQMSFNLPEI